MINVVIHSTLRHLTDSPNYKVDITNARDVAPYLCNTQRKFNEYQSKIKTGQVDESFSLVDGDFNVISTEDFDFKQLKPGETVYVVPYISGGGGKRGFLLLIAVAIVAPYAIGLAGGASASAGFGAVYKAGLTSLGTGASSMFGAGGLGGSGLGASFARSIIGNLALSLVTSLFAAKPKPQEQVDSSTRGSDMFGSLQNTTQGGTPIALVYGQTRVAGQFISGYLDTLQHGKEDVVKVSEQFKDA